MRTVRFIHDVIAAIRYRMANGPSPKFATRLPRGVRILTGEEEKFYAKNMHSLPVLKELNLFDVGSFKKRIGEDVYNALEREHRRFLAKECRNFSCGIALRFNRNGQSGLYEPYDLRKRLSAHLVQFLEKRGVTV